MNTQGQLVTRCPCGNKADAATEDGRHLCWSCYARDDAARRATRASTVSPPR